MRILAYKRKLTGAQRSVGCFAVILVLLVGWEMSVRFLDVPSYILPPPSAILRDLFKFREILLANMFVTAGEALLGLTVTTVLGVGLAIIFQIYSRADELGYPIVVGLQSFPKEALAPLLVVWFGFGVLSKIILASAIAFFPVFISTLRGLKSIPRDVLYTFLSLRASQKEILLKCRIPFALPYAFSGIRVASTLSVVGAVIGEFIGSSSGLGHLILSANSQFSVSLVFACLVILGLLGLALDTTIVFIERRLMPWHESLSEINYILETKP